MADVDQVTIAPGVAMPQLGLGVWRMSDDEASAAVAGAIGCGYRAIDTAAIYRNERGVAAGLRRAGLAREAVFVTTKLWNDRQRDARRALGESLERLGLDHVDLYLIHWPAPQADAYVDAWRALVGLRDEGLARSVGVSNFAEAHLTRAAEATGVMPAVNQIELHPYLQQAALRAFHAGHGVVTQAWSPIGQGKGLLADPVLAELAAKHGKTAAQVVLRWHLQLGTVVIPKSVTPSRIRENIDIAGFALDERDMAAIAGLDRGERLGPDPATFG